MCCPIQCNFYCSISHSCDICVCNKMGKLEKVFILIKLLRLIFMFRLIFIIIFIFIFIRYLLSYSYSYISVRMQYLSVQVQYIYIYYHINIHIHIHIYGQLNHICLSGCNIYLSERIHTIPHGPGPLFFHYLYQSRFCEIRIISLFRLSSKME